ncbi:MAG: glycosyltransferase family 4 protein [Alistipes sp.]
MNILFLTLVEINNLHNSNIYTDLLRQFVNDGHKVYIARSSERRFKEPQRIQQEDNVTILSIRTLNIQKTNRIEKGIATILLQHQFQKAITKYFNDVKFDLILYSTPPITFNSIIQKIKRRDGALSYLLLKDIFPQNAVDLGMFSKHSIFYWYFRRKEKELYKISDYIGCMSPANVRYTLQNNLFLSAKKVEISPNSIEIHDEPIINKDAIRLQYKLPVDKRIFIYGGNLGKPQGIDFLITALQTNINNDKTYFIIVGGGTEYAKLASWFKQHNPTNSQLIASLPPLEYDQLMSACDIGIILLDRRFSIPNYPSRLLSYLKRQMPILLATDKNTDIGQIAIDNDYGLWSESGDIVAFNQNIDTFLSMDDAKLHQMGVNGWTFLKNNYDVKSAYRTILSHIKP